MCSFKLHSAAFFLIHFGIANAQLRYTEDSSTDVVGSCSKLKDNDTFLGTMDSFSQEGLLPSLILRLGIVGGRPFVRIIRSKILCEAPGYFRNTAFSHTIIVEYQNQRRIGLRRVLLTVDCMEARRSNTKSFQLKSFHYVPVNTGRSRETPRFGSTFNTFKRTDCGECSLAESPLYDTLTGCAG